MLYNLLYPLHLQVAAFNIFKYITFRAIMAALTAFVASLIFGPLVIRWLKSRQFQEQVQKNDSAELDKRHAHKKGTPTMGGIFINIAIVVSTFLWADMSNKFIWLALLSTVWLGMTGFLDDYLKLHKSVAKGLSAKAKLISQITLSLVVGILLIVWTGHSTVLEVPFFKSLVFDLGVWYLLVVVLVLTGSSNAVNLTDGLDGLAAGCVTMAALAFAILSYVTGNIRISEYLLFPYIRGSGELTVFCASIFGAGLGFLWFNCYPASVFMGDVGSLALGGALGITALAIKKELLLVLVGGVFVLEAASVILQVTSFKLWKKRIFKCAPLHHHFQFLNWQENKVIVRFWIAAILFTLVTLLTLKTR